MNEAPTDQRKHRHNNNTSSLIKLALMSTILLFQFGCNEQPTDTSQTAQVDEVHQLTPDSEPVSASMQETEREPLSPAATLAADIALCVVPDPKVPSSAFDIFTSPADDQDDFWVEYSCKQTCSDWNQCQVPAYSDDNGMAIMHGRNGNVQKSALAFVVDGMGGHLVFSQDGNKTVVIHAGAGGTRYYTEVANSLEQQSTMRTAMIRWEKGITGREVVAPFTAPVDWGWYSRTSESATTIRKLSQRVAGIIAWVHENLADDQTFATMGCSMGTNATFMPVLWHGLDPIIDYQLFVGGPNMWDLNAHCGLRQYDQGYCDLDGTTNCKTDSDCSALGPQAQCAMPRPYSVINKVYDEFANRIHKTKTCDILGADAESQPDPAFDESSMGYVADADWQINHPVDILVNIGGEIGESGFGGDYYWDLGDFAFVYNRIDAPQGKQWHAFTESHHCDAMTSGAAVSLIIDRLGE